MSGVTFIDYEPPGSRSWRAVVAELRQQPGRWAEVDRGPSFTSVGSGAQRLKALGCEIRRRQIDGEVVLYARSPEQAA